MTAYEELKAWCEKYLNKDEYKIVPESTTYDSTIYIEPDDMGDSIPCFLFNEDGSFMHSGVYPNEEMCDHIRDYEKIKK